MFGVSVSSISRTIKKCFYAIELSDSYLEIPGQDIVEIKMKMFKTT